MVAVMTSILRRLVVLFLGLAAVILSSSCTVPVPSAAGPRLYVLDCGTIGPLDPKLFGLAANEIKGTAVWLAAPCFLVVHSKGTLIWDVGHISDAGISGDGGEVVQRDVFRARRRLRAQLADLGYSVEDIDYLAMSHHHSDHTANANAFVASTWIVQQPEYDVMFSDASARLRVPYRALEKAKRIALNDADHDVFGDGTVVVKSAPGHTPGHQVLFLKLSKFGPLLLMGDLYHLREQKVLDRVSTFEFDGAMTRRTRRSVETFIAESGAQAWIQHDPLTYSSLKKAPAYYD
jgi:N-acyl homoserine lactone hydrolase